MTVSRKSDQDRRKGQMRWWFVLLFPLLLLVLWLTLYLTRFELSNQTKVFDVISKIASISAIVIGGVWSYRAFFRQRLHAPRLNAQHEIESIELPDGRHLLKVYALLENVGQIKLALRLWRLRAEQLLPLTECAKQIIESKEAFTEYSQPWLTVAGAKDGIFQRDSFEVLLEPGESDRAIGNLVLPNDVQVVQIVSHFQLDMDHEWPSWLTQTIVDLRKHKENS